MLDTFAIAEKLRQISEILLLRGGRAFQARAYEHGADVVESVSPAQLERLIWAGKLTELSGIGPSLAHEIDEIAREGHSSFLNALTAEVPPGVVELTRVPGLSLKKALALRDALGIGSLDALDRACREERVRTVAGFGPATELKIAKGIAEYRARPDRILLVDARPLSERVLHHVATSGRATRAAIAGGVRRWCETVDEITIVAATDAPDALLDHAARFPPLARIEDRSAGRLLARLSSGVRVQVHAVPPDAYDVALVRHTGSASHVRALEALAKDRGLSLDAIGARCEADVYRALGLPFLPPETREGASELEEARHGRMEELVALADIKGMVHCHTLYSDGRDTIEAMAHKADALGMEYLTITDHSPTAHYAGGVTLDRLKAQWDEIARVQEGVRVKLLRGTESDILKDGALDYPDDVLERFDVVVASIHARMKMSASEMTERVVRAMQVPVFKVWGHPLGRLLLRRPPFECDVEGILDVIAEGKRAAIEINGDPYRLDMEPKWLRAARARDIPFVVSTDAHSTGGMENLIYGVAMARRGGLTRGEVLNTQSAGAFCDAVRPVRA